MSKLWTQEKAWDWYQHQPWIVGSNFIPSTAINQIEMWQAEDFNPQVISKELSLARSIGFNTVRVYLHNLVWEQDADGFKKRINTFLELASNNGIKPIFVVFDDCWNSTAFLRKQPDPIPGKHNSGWVQSPGISKVNDPNNWGVLKEYLQDVMTSFAMDDRIRCWDLYNEPGNSGQREKSLPFLKEVFEWAREVELLQPITVGVWFDCDELNQFQLQNSDVISFHNYLDADNLISQLADLKKYERPLICTEYMARVKGSRFETHLPIFKAEKVGCINWGLVNGKTQTNLPWASEPQSEFWFHDIFKPDYTPYSMVEVEFIRRTTGEN